MDSNFYAHESVIIDEGAQIGEGTKIWHFSHVMSGAVVGSNCTIGQNVFISSGVKIGNNVKIQNNVSLYSGVSCGDDVFIGPSAVFTNVVNPRSHVNRKNEFLKTHIQKGATIGANATIICGNTIGEYAFIGAGSVVVNSVSNYALLAGNPGKSIGWMSKEGHRLTFNPEGLALCPLSGKHYCLIGEKEVKELAE